MQADTNQIGVEVGAWMSYSHELMAARRGFRAGALAYASYRAIEDQIAGDVPSDARCFVTGTEGLAHGSPGQLFAVLDKVTAAPCPAVDEFAYVSGCTEFELQVTLPSPLKILRFWSDQAREVYADPSELVQDAGAVIKTWTRELTDAGCRHVEVDRPKPENEVTVFGLISTLWTTQKALS